MNLLDGITAREAQPLNESLALVVIGRNEGERLRTCLESVARETAAPLVYVDSGSHDGSVALAQALRIPVVILDEATPFTAARARNAGFAYLMERFPDLDFIQFIDGDCELIAGWIETALRTLREDPRLAAVCGRRRERYPDASPYNRLCDREWNTPVGLASTCGGDFLIRAAAFGSVGGFNPGLIAGEEPDMCHRMRQLGWLIRRIDCEMTIHDAAMSDWRQWWQRNRRSGYATAEALTLRGRRNFRMWRAVASNFFWALPPGWLLWPLLWLQVRARGGPLFATAIMLGKLPHAQGQIDYWRHRRRLIEYK